MKFISVNKILISLFFLCQFLFTNCQKEPPDLSKDWVLTFSEEFSDSTINKNIWRTEFPWGQGSSDANTQLYIDSAFVIKDGILQIIAKRDTVMGLVHDDNYNYFYKPFYLTTGMLESDVGFSQQYGYFEIRSKIPYGTGFWPAFWLMAHSGWPPEIDVFEISGREPNRLHMANHYKDKKGIHGQYSTTINGPDFSKDFHVFGIEWNPKEIIWYLDNKKVFRTETNIPNERMYLIVNLGVGGGFFSGDVCSTTPFPSSFDIDYIRVYQKK